MQVSVALGILISELTHSAFRDRVLTFHEKPSWFDLSDCKTLKEKVSRLLKAPWGGSTNFEAALQLILDACVAAKLPESELPEGLVVISDMQFDAAAGRGCYGWEEQKSEKWETKYEKIAAQWKAAGYSKVPRIVFWNVRGATKKIIRCARIPRVWTWFQDSPKICSRS